MRDHLLGAVAFMAPTETSDERLPFPLGVPRRVKNECRAKIDAEWNRECRDVWKFERKKFDRHIRAEDCRQVKLSPEAREHYNAIKFSERYDPLKWPDGEGRLIGVDYAKDVDDQCVAATVSGLRILQEAASKRMREFEDALRQNPMMSRNWPTPKARAIEALRNNGMAEFHRAVMKEEELIRSNIAQAQYAAATRAANPPVATVEITREHVKQAWRKAAARLTGTDKVASTLAAFKDRFASTIASLLPEQFAAAKQFFDAA